MKTTNHQKLLSLAAIICLITSSKTFALPLVEQVIHGNAAFNTVQNSMQIQASDKAIINYNSFNINTNEIVKFIQPSSNSIVLNRVILSNPSLILGSLLANGRVFLINPAGIVFGKNSKINTNSFLATTLNITDKDFLNSHYQFNQLKNIPKSYIFQQGDIEVSPEGFVVLASPFIKNSGVIIAKSGSIKIGGVDNFYINFDSNGLIMFEHNPTTSTKKDILLTNKDADKIIQNVINDVTSQKDIKVVKENGVIKIVNGSGTALLTSGKLNSNAIEGKNAGSIEVASQTLTSLQNTKLSSNAKSNGNGGVIKINSDQNTHSFKNSSYEAKAGEKKGGGGFVEISAKKTLILDGGRVDTSAKNGKNGLFFNDPDDLVVTDDITLNGSDYVTVADNFTLEKDKAIKTKGGDIEINAYNIYLKDNSSLDTTSKDKSGDITLLAGYDKDILETSINHATKHALIDISDGVKITGKNIKLKAIADGSSVFDSNSDNTALKVLQKAGDFILDMPVTPIAFQWVDTSAGVKIAKAEISGSNIDIQAISSSNVDIYAHFLTLALAYGKSQATSTIDIANGAKLNSTGDISLNSKTDTFNKVISKASNFWYKMYGTKSQKLEKVDKQNIAVAYTKTDTTATTTINSGATINAGGNLDISSIGKKNIATGASGASYSNGNLGVAIAFSRSDSNVKTILGGDITAKNINIKSITDVKSIKTGSSAGVGNGFLAATQLEKKPAQAIAGKTQTIMQKITKKEQTLQTDEKQGAQKISISVAYTDSKHSQTNIAYIDKDADIKTNGNLAVDANIIYENNPNDSLLGNEGIKSIAIATIDSNDKYKKKNSFSGAVTISHILNNTKSYIDDSATVVTNGGDIDINSKITATYNIDWNSIKKCGDGISSTNSWKDIFKNIKDDSTVKWMGDLAGFRTKLYTSYAQSNAQGTDLSLSGSINFFIMTNKTDSHIGKNVNINIPTDDALSKSGKVSIIAESDIAIMNYAGVIGWTYFGTKAANGIGGAYLDLRYGGYTKAYIDSESNIYTKNFKVQATSKINNISFATAGGQGDNMLSGSFSLLNLGDDKDTPYKTYAFIDGANITLDKDSDDNSNDIKANNDFFSINGTGGLVIGKNSGVGISSSLNFIRRDTEAYVANSQLLKDTQNIANYELSAINSANLVSYSLSGVVAKGNKAKTPDTEKSDNNENEQEISKDDKSKKAKFGVAISGDAVVNKFYDNAQAFITSSSFLKQIPQDQIRTNLNPDQASITLEAKNHDDAIGATGSLSLDISGNKKSGGIAGSYSGNYYSNKADSHIESSTIEAKDVTMDAINYGESKEYAAGGSGGTSIASLAGSVIINSIVNSARSYSSDSKMALNSLKQTATQYTQGYSYAGSLSIAKALGVGASFSKNDIKDTTHSYIKSSEIASSDTIDIKTYQKDSIEAWSGTIGGATKGMALSASVILNTLNSDIQSYISTDDTLSSTIDAKAISLKANDTSSIKSYAGSVSGGKSVAVGASFIHNIITNSVQNDIESSTISTPAALTLLTLSNKDITTITVGGSGAGTASIAGGLTINDMQDDINSYIKNSKIISSSLSNQAIEQNHITSYAGTANGAGTVGIGGSMIKNNIANHLKAFIYSSIIDTKGNFPIKLPKKDSEDYSDTFTVKGLVNLALANEKVEGYSANVSGAGTVAIVGSINYNTLGDDLRSYILDSNINQNSQNPSPYQSLYVRALVHDKLNINTGGASGAGTAGVGGSLNSSELKNSTNAYIDSSAVKTNKLAEVRAESKETLKAVTISGAGAGTASLAGSTSLINIANNNEAKIINNSIVSSKKDISVIAKDKSLLGYKQDKDKYTQTKIMNGTASAAGVAGVGGTVTINSIKNSSLAHIDNSFVNAAEKLYLYSSNFAMISNLLGTAGIGQGAIAGTININSIDSSTKSYTTGITGINLDKDYVSDDQSIEISANDYTYIKDHIITATVALGSIGASVDITTTKSDTKARIGNHTVIKNKKDVNVLAKSKKVFKNSTKSGGASVVGLGGSIVIANLGGSFGDDAKPIINKVGNFIKKMFSSINDNGLTDTESVKFDDNKITKNCKTKASIGDDVKMDTGGKTTLQSQVLYQDIDIDSGNGGTSTIGGSAALLYLGVDNEAYIGKESDIKIGELTINSKYTIDNLKARSYNGQIGILGSLGADYTKITNNYNNIAAINEKSQISATDNISINALTNENIMARGYGAEAAAGLSAGLSSAKIVSNGTTKTNIQNQVNLNAKNDIDIQSLYDTKNNVYTKASSGGIAGSVAGSVAKIDNKAYIENDIGDSVVMMSLDGDINVDAIVYNVLKTQASGFSAAALASAGGSVAEALFHPYITSHIGKSTKLYTNNFIMHTYLNMDKNGKKIDDNGVYAKATASNGALGGSVNGTKSHSVFSPNIATVFDKNFQVEALKNIYIKTKGYSKTDSYSSGKVGGILAAGFVKATSYNNGGMNFELKNGSDLHAKNDILINNYSKKNAYDTAYGGVGGALAGSGTKTYAKISNSSYITIDDDTQIISDTGDVDIYNTGNIWSNLYAQTKSAGFVNINSVQSYINIDEQNLNIDIKKSKIQGKNIDIKSQVEKLYTSSESYSKIYAANGYANAYAYLDSTSNTNVDIEDGAYIIGKDSVNVKSYQMSDDVFTRAKATSTISPSLIGILKSSTRNNPHFNSRSAVHKGSFISKNSTNYVNAIAPKKKIPKDYKNSYNYVNYPKVENHSVSYYVEKKVWDFVDGFWHWVTKKELHHKWSQAKEEKTGTWKSDATDYNNATTITKSFIGSINPSGFTVPSNDELIEDIENFTQNYQQVLTSTTTSNHNKVMQGIPTLTLQPDIEVKKPDFSNVVPPVMALPPEQTTPDNLNVQISNIGNIEDIKINIKNPNETVTKDNDLQEENTQIPISQSEPIATVETKTDNQMQNSYQAITHFDIVNDHNFMAKTLQIKSGIFYQAPLYQRQAQIEQANDKEKGVKGQRNKGGR